jgi:hypothetical protein
MNQNFNPYQAPQSQEYLPQQTGECWREGKRVFLPDGANLPHRCIRCGEAAEPQRRPRKLYWYHPAWNLLIIPIFFIAWPIALIIALAVRKSLPIHPALCPQHQKQMRWLFWGVPAIVLVLLLLPLITQIVPALNDALSQNFIIMWYFSIIAFCLIFAIATSPLRPRLVKVTEDYNILKNFGRGFLDTLPEEYELNSRR